MRETACAIVDKLNSGEVTPLDLLDVLEKRIAEVDGKVNALPTLCFDRARDHAKALMKKPAGERGLLAGLPVPIKDLTNVEGVLTTQGSPIYKDTIPGQFRHPGRASRRQWRRGLRQIQHAGIRRRRQHLQRSVRRDAQSLGHVALRRRLLGRRGGGARHRHGVARARLRHGRLAAQPRELLRHRRHAARASAASRIRLQSAIDRNLGVQGPMARNVEDLALLLDAMSGEHPADPLSLPLLPTSFLSAARSGNKPKRIAYSPDLGITPVDPEVAAITRKAARAFRRSRRHRRGSASRSARGP